MTGGKCAAGYDETATPCNASSRAPRPAYKELPRATNHVSHHARGRPPRPAQFLCLGIRWSWLQVVACSRACVFVSPIRTVCVSCPARSDKYRSLHSLNLSSLRRQSRRSSFFLTATRCCGRDQAVRKCPRRRPRCRPSTFKKKREDPLWSADMLAADDAKPPADSSTAPPHCAECLSHARERLGGRVAMQR